VPPSLIHRHINRQLVTGYTIRLGKGKVNVDMYIGVARILSGGALFWAKKVDDLKI